MYIVPSLVSSVEAQEWFKRAAVLNDMGVQKAGIEDPDLKLLWDGMSTPIWKKSD